jgi:multicomponent Na+:H+ antiporter subunit B
MSGFEIISLALLAILLVTALVVTRLRALFDSTMLTALFSLVMASLFVLFDAVDVAFTEAAVGVGISTILLIGALQLTRSRESFTPARRWAPGLAAVLLAGGTLIWASQDLPDFGAADSPVQTHPVTEVYLQQSQEDIGIPNTVTAVLASYRGLDTLGELVVILTAGIGVLTLLGPLTRAQEAPAHRVLDLADYRVLRVIGALLMPFILLFGLYVLFHGDYGAGGGFQAGVIFAAGFVLYGLVFGVHAAQRVVPRRVLWTFIPLGVLLYAGVGVVSMLRGDAFLDYDSLNPGHPESGQHVGILLVETAIGITVAAVMMSIFFSFAHRVARR